MKKLEILRNVTLELVNYCNSTCVHCYLNPLAPKMVELNDVIRVIDQAADAGAMQITVTGGEPLLHSNIKEIIEHIKSKGMAINLLTSLNLAPGDWLEDTIMCDKIGVSIYGSVGDIHDRITNTEGSFDTMINNLKHLVDRNLFITLNMTIIKENVADAENMIALAKRMNLPYRLNYILHGSSAMTHQIALEDTTRLRSALDQQDNNETILENFKCVAGSDSLWVDVDLNVYPCAFFRLQLGNLFSQTLGDIWSKSTAIKEIKKTVNTDFKKCQVCDLKYVCTPCIGENYNENGDITIPCAFSCRIGVYGKCLH